MRKTTKKTVIASTIYHRGGTLAALLLYQPPAIRGSVHGSTL